MKKETTVNEEQPIKSATMRKAFRSQYDGKESGGTEKVSNISDTVPNRSMSLQEIMFRFASGRQIPSKKGIYTGDEIMPQAAKMSHMDMHDMNERMKSLISDKEAEVRSLTEKRRKAIAEMKEKQKAAQRDALRAQMQEIQRETGRSPVN